MRSHPGKGKGVNSTPFLKALEARRKMNAKPTPIARRELDAALTTKNVPDFQMNRPDVTQNLLVQVLSFMGFLSGSFLAENGGCVNKIV
jgi:hypothetical protein